MEEKISFDNVEKIINKFLDAFVEEYKKELIADGKKASGNLINSIKKLEVEVNGTKYIGKISLADYWKWVEYGRKPGKFPPINKILTWIEQKPIIPRPVNNITPTNKQLAFLIGRKIANEGIKPGNQFENSLSAVNSKFNRMLQEALEKDIDGHLSKIYKDAFK